MAQAWKQITILGNTGRDPETRFLQDGTQVTSFSVGVENRSKKGEAKTSTWFRVTCWRKLAEIANEYVRKGTKVLVVGDLTTREYEPTDGSGKRFSVEITADSVVLLTTKAEAEAAGRTAGAAPAQPAKTADDWFNTDSADLPF